MLMLIQPIAGMPRTGASLERREPCETRVSRTVRGLGRVNRLRLPGRLGGRKRAVLTAGAGLTTSAGMKVRAIMTLIQQDGWYLDRTRGSHRQYKHPQKRGLVTVPGKPNDDLAPGTLNSILKQAGLK